MHCIDNENIKYEVFLYRLAEKKSGSNTEMFSTSREKWVALTEIEDEKKEFRNRTEEIKGIDPKMKEHNDYCREWTANGINYIEYIIGFVSLEQ